MLRLSSLARLTLIGAAAAMVATACGSSDNTGSSTPSTAAVQCGTTALTGAGATFPAPFYQKAFYDYNSKCSAVTVNYQAIGSGGGIKAFIAKTVDFGASDVPMGSADITSAGGPDALTQVPTTLGVVSIAYNVKGVDKLQLDGPTLAGIYLGTIKKWNDSAITATNSGVNLPNESITVFHRSDGSGTTYHFSDYLAKISPDWKSKTGSPAKSITWPTGQGASGNQAVAQGVTSTEGGIGYVELAYVVQAGMKQAYLKNANGKFVQASVDGATAAAGTNNNVGPTNFSITNASCDACYPIAGFSWAILYTNYTDSAKGKSIAYLFKWLVTDGQADGKDLQYATLPSAVQQLALTNLKLVKVGGTAVLG
jgi:phosphate transport system substrate-binding protein